MKNYFLNLLLLIIPFVGINAQKVLNKGYIKMEFTDLKASDPQMQQGLEMMKGTTTEIYFNEKMSKSVVDMMGGMMNIVTLKENNSDKTSMYYNMMGQKMLIEISDEEAKKMNKDQDIKPQVTYDKSKTKNILGYNCYAMEVKMPNNMTMTGWMTEDIKAAPGGVQGVENLELKGFPLEITIKMGDKMSMTIKTTEIKDTVSDDVFKVDPTGYKKMTMEEFQKSVGGSMGF